MMFKFTEKRIDYIKILQEICEEILCKIISDDPYTEFWRHIKTSVNLHGSEKAISILVHGITTEADPMIWWLEKKVNPSIMAEDEEDELVEKLTKIISDMYLKIRKKEK